MDLLNMTNEEIFNGTNSKYWCVGAYYNYRLLSLSSQLDTNFKKCKASFVDNLLYSDTTLNLSCFYDTNNEFQYLTSAFVDGFASLGGLFGLDSFFESGWYGKRGRSLCI
jgi:hypothetical protein